MRIWVTCLALVSTAVFAGCSPNQRIINSSAEFDKANAPTQVSGTPQPAKVEDDIAAMKTADFNFVYVFRRKDGGEFDANDRAFVNANTPYEINRRKLSDGGRAIVIGSNFKFPAENFAQLKERFSFEDHSPPSGMNSTNLSSPVR